MVWCVSSSRVTRREGSSSQSRWSADISLSSSARVAGFTATERAAAGSEGGTTLIGWPFTARVSPVCVPLSRGTATKSPAAADGTALAACPTSDCRACKRSSSRVRVLTRTLSASKVPDTTLHSDIFPVWLSL